jgi:Mn2+/Fe2+ NRAMP family transporter
VFYGLLVLGLLVGTVLAAVLTDAIGLLVFSAMLNAIAAAPFLVVVLLISGSGRLMGQRRNGRLATTAGWATAVVMAVVGVLAIWAQFG